MHVEHVRAIIYLVTRARGQIVIENSSLHARDFLYFTDSHASNGDNLANDGFLDDRSIIGYQFIELNKLNELISGQVRVVVCGER